MRPDVQKPWFPRYRDKIIFHTGLVGVALETVGHVFFGRQADPSLLVLFAGMMGLPAFLPKDGKE